MQRRSAHSDVGQTRHKIDQLIALVAALKACRPYTRAILARVHKVLHTIVAMLRDNRPYTDPGIDYEKLLVDRIAAL